MLGYRSLNNRMVEIRDEDGNCSDIRSQKQADINSNTTGLIEQAI